jgi:hypothetical protein
VLATHHQRHRPGQFGVIEAAIGPVAGMPAPCPGCLPGRTAAAQRPQRRLC